MSSNNDGFQPTKFVIVGRSDARVEGKKGTVVATIMQRVNADGALHKEREVYTSKELRSKNVGSVYMIDATETSIRPSTARWVSLWQDREQAAQWQTEERAYEAVKTAIKRERDANSPLALEVLRPLRLAYSKTNYQGKIAIEVLILNYIRMNGAEFDDEEQRARASYSVEAAIRKHFDLALKEYLAQPLGEAGVNTPAEWWRCFLDDQREVGSDKK